MTTNDRDDRRVALITGASRGLGETLANFLAQRGFNLVLGARHRADLERVANDLRSAGQASPGYTPIVLACDGDIAAVETRDALVRAAEELGGLDLLVNNASELGGLAPLADVDLDRLERLLRVNVIAPLALTQLALPLLAARRGLVVNISSDAAIGAYAGWGSYGATKAALDLVGRTLATELTPNGVSIVTVDPGDMRTRMHQEAFPNDDISDRPLPDVTVPFWNWLLDQPAATINGERFQAQSADPRWTPRAAATAVAAGEPTRSGATA
jgi:NAD(P)-dependent dehydrogenase (short-subunit alcohol dehydrogenase family)